MDKKTLLLAVAACSMIQLHAENITFSDSKVKALCVQHWDSNKDGELSTDEAAAVTSLGSVFRSNKTITSFEELRFFTGLSAIDDYTFYQSTLQTVAFPASAASIGEYAFSESSISGEVQTIGWKSFTGPIGTLSLPSTLTYMSSMAIDPYVSAGSSSGVMIPEGDLYVYVHSTTPPAVHNYAFYYMFTDCHLVVPFGCIEAYKAAYAWSKFGQYLEYGDVNMDGYVNNRDVISTRAFILGNNPSPFDERMADVNGDGTINNRDVILLRNNVMR